MEDLPASASHILHALLHPSETDLADERLHLRARDLDLRPSIAHSVPRILLALPSEPVEARQLPDRQMSPYEENGREPSRAESESYNNRDEHDAGKGVPGLTLSHSVTILDIADFVVRKP